MDHDTPTKLHWSFWIICVLGLLWNAGGAANYISQTSADFVATMPETHRAIIVGRPAWATGGFAIGVFGGALGCLLLMLRKSIAFHVFIASLLGILATMIHTVDVAATRIEFSNAEIIVMILLPVLVAALLAAYARLGINRNWIS